MYLPHLFEKKGEGYEDDEDDDGSKITKMTQSSVILESLSPRTNSGIFVPYTVVFGKIVHSPSSVILESLSPRRELGNPHTNLRLCEDYFPVFARSPRRSNRFLKKASNISSISFIETRCRISWTATGFSRKKILRGDEER